jgi:hypothetical protein
MMENEEHEILWSQAARNIANEGRAIAAAAGVTLTVLKWHRGDEVADLDNFWLTLESGTRAVTEHFPNEWLEEPANTENDPRITQRLLTMIETLVAGAKT